MSAIYRIQHETRYRHSAPVTVSQHVGCLTPRRLPQQILHAWRLDVTPEPDDRGERLDYFGNVVTQLSIVKPYTELLVHAESRVAANARPRPIAPDGGPAWETVRDAGAWRVGRALGDADEYRYPSPFVEIDAAFAGYARADFAPRRPLLAAAIALMHRVHHDFTFDPGTTTVTTPLSRVLIDRRGVCQDFAHVLIGCLRSLGLPARYVSGYLLTDPPPGSPRLLGADASHAWLSVWCPSHGWVDLDPTNDVLPDERHITVAWGRDYGDVSPLRGVVLGGGEHELSVAVSVVPEGEA
ncbi:MAG TPA: transglutaminase family protein [Vicinamibacterales bacterium]|jgi:transglutaminase-like putative cysteine protease